MPTSADINEFKKSLIILEKQIVDALKDKDWSALESADDKVQATIKFWVDSLSGSGHVRERDDAIEFIAALMERYKTYLSDIAELKEEAAQEMSRLQTKKTAINQYLNNKF